MKVVIIGAGVAGLAIGWRLAQAGANVTILERSQPGSGATGAAAGMIAVTAELADAHAAEIEFARYANQLWPAFAEEIEDISDHVTGYARNGALILAPDEAALARLAKRAAEPGLEMVDQGQLRELAPLVTSPQSGGLWSPQEALVDNKALAAALVIAVQRAGVHLSTNEAVVRIERKGGRAAIAHTPIGLHHADVFLMTAGAWSGLVEPELAPITPIKGEMIALAPPPGQQLSSRISSGPVIWGNGIYAVPRGALLMIGATVQNAGFDTSLTDAARNDLRARAEAMMPCLRDWSLADHWAGLRPRSPDSLPLLGPTAQDGLWLASGQFRNGILFAPAIADSITAQILGNALPMPAFDPRRFGPQK